MSKRSIFFFSVCLVLGAIACKKLAPQPAKEEDLLDGPVEGLSTEERSRFLKGDVAFNDDVFTAETGLGPIFVSTSCGSCHAGDGKGHPFTSLTRFGQVDSSGNLFLEKGGPQLQNKAIPGFVPEQIPAGATSARILPPANTGLGYIDAVSDADILAMADPQDLNGDGISGTPNWVKAPAYCEYRPQGIEQNEKHIGRFGRKGAAYDLLQQTANAYNQDMGISSGFESIDTYSKLPVDPEVSNATIYDVVFYLRTLKAPIPRNQNDAGVIAGKEIFSNTGCANCHTPKLKTSQSKINALANKEFYPFTDLLLHDMGKDLDDGYTEGSAKTYEWKTPALWGIGLSKNSQGGTYYLLHDGRAHSIEEAILMHGGEALQSKNNFQQLSGTDKNNLLKFLENL